MPAVSAPSAATAAATVPAFRRRTITIGVGAGDRIDEYDVYVSLCCAGWPPLATLHLEASKVRVHLRRDGDAHDVAVAAPRANASPPSSIAPSPAGTTRTFPAFAGYKLDVASQPPGWYTLTASVEPGAIVDASGAAAPPDEVRAIAQRVYVPPRPGILPAYAPGQQFIFLPGTLHGKPPPFFGSHGERESFATYSLQPLTYLGAQDRLVTKALQFATADGRKTTIEADTDLTHVPGLYPLVQDAESRAVAEKYLGHLVWRFGDSPMYAGFTQLTLGMRPGRAARVLGVYRPYGYPFQAAVGSSPFAEPRFLAIDPLVVALRVNGNDMLPAQTDAVPAIGPTAYWLVSGAWDMERTFSLVSMQQAHPEWDGMIRDAILAQTILPGMTHDMVAWAKGYPSVVGTAAAMNKLDTWNFDQPPPNSSTVIFRDGHVVRYVPPGPMM